MATDNKEHLDAEAKKKRSAAMNWPVKERGDRLGKWDSDGLKLALPFMETEEREAIVRRFEYYDRLANKRSRRGK